MKRLSILLTVTVAAGISAFVLSTHRPSTHASVSELPAQPTASQPKVEPPTGDWSNALNFAVAGDRAISELHEGITVNEWKAHHPGATKIDPASIGIGGECVILAEGATLTDGVARPLIVRIGLTGGFLALKRENPPRTFVLGDARSWP